MTVWLEMWECKIEIIALPVFQLSERFLCFGIHQQAFRGNLIDFFLCINAAIRKEFYYCFPCYIYVQNPFSVLCIWNNACLTSWLLSVIHYRGEKL